MIDLTECLAVDIELKGGVAKFDQTYAVLPGGFIPSGIN